MKYLSTFSGIGGFEIGIQRAFNNRSDLRNGTSVLPGLVADTSQRKIRATCIGYSEVDSHAIKTYEEHYDHTNFGDITAINAESLPDFDLIVGGFPCQAFSVAGKRRGFDETRGTLFFDLARILKHKRPGHFVFENVKGLLSHDGGKTIQTIAGVLSDLGYRIEWQVLNSKDFGVPQNRERIYIVGHLRDRCVRQVLPIVQGGGWSAESQSKQSGQGQRLRSDDTPVVAQTIRSRDYKGGNNLINQLNQPKIVAQRGRGGIKDTKQMFENRKDYLSNTLTAVQKDNMVDYGQARIRRLTPTECERLQGFPDGWTVGSDTQRYKQCGNAVTTNVVEAVMLRLKECL